MLEDPAENNNFKQKKGKKLKRRDEVDYDLQNRMFANASMREMLSAVIQCRTLSDPPMLLCRLLRGSNLDLR